LNQQNTAIANTTTPAAMPPISLPFSEKNFSVFETASTTASALGFLISLAISDNLYLFISVQKQSANLGKNVQYQNNFLYLRGYTNIKPYIMRIKSEYKLRNVAGETIIVRQGTAQIDLTKVISLNSSARVIYEALAGKEFSLEDIVEVLTDKYEIGTAKAEEAAHAWIDSMKECNLIEE
jgi:hypothetical protein